MDQPTAEQALRELKPLVGAWTFEARWPDGTPWRGGGRVTFEWHDSGAHLVERGTAELPEAPDNVSIIGCDAANGRYFQLYSDDRGVCRVYEMSIGNGEWKLWRKGEPFAQRFTATFSDDGNTITRTLGDRRRRHRLHDRLRPHLPQSRLLMQADEIRFLFAYDRWATRHVLTVLDGLDPAVWTRTHVVDERGLGGILVHHLGASQRWRHGFQDTGEEPEPELEPLPTIDQLRERWEAEWAAVDAWLATVTDGFVAYVHEGVPVWQMLVHVVNHGTQHRAEAAALLTAEGRSPGELDLINYAEEQAERVSS